MAIVSTSLSDEHFATVQHIDGSLRIGELAGKQKAIRLSKEEVLAMMRFLYEQREAWTPISEVD